MYTGSCVRLSMIDAYALSAPVAPTVMRIDSDAKLPPFTFGKNDASDACGERTYATEHRFLERPDAETVKLLFDEAKRHFRLVYDDEIVPEDFSVRLRHLDPDERE